MTLIGAKSLTTLNDVLTVAGMMAISGTLASSSVCPSGGARATNSAATAPAAPGRLSTMNCWPNVPPSRVATKRATSSELPPLANGTTILTGRCGQDCDNACDDACGQA